MFWTLYLQFILCTQMSLIHFQLFQMYGKHVDKPSHTKLDTKFTKWTHVYMNLFNVTSLQALKYNVLLFFEHYITFFVNVTYLSKYGIQIFVE